VTDEPEPSEERDSPREVRRRRRAGEVGGLVDLERVDLALDEQGIEENDATFAAELARLSGADDEARSALFVGLLALGVARRRGSVRIDLMSGGSEGLAARLADRLPAVFDDAEEARPAAEVLLEGIRSGDVDTVVGESGAYRPLIVDGGHLYRHRDWCEEERLADAIAARIAPGWRGSEWPEVAPWGGEFVAERLETVAAASDPRPTVEQLYAVATAATSPLSVVTGGPGTGKTSLVVTLLRLVVALGVEPDRIALAAPTGKAADRLGEEVDRRLAAGLGGREQLSLAGVGSPAPEAPAAIDRRLEEALEEPSTLHRLLGYSERRRDFHHDEYRPLPHDYVVVDEASMIDLELMDRLVAAVERRARLVLVGDADQLPAVGAGAVFRDLVPETFETATPRARLVGGELREVESGEPLAAQGIALTENFRMRADDPAGSRVLAVARAVRNGGDAIEFAEAFGDESAAPRIVERETFSEMEFRGAEILPDGREDWLGRWYGRTVEAGVFDRVDWWEPVEFERGTPTEEGAGRLGRLFGALRDYQLLAVTRKRPRGVERIDGILHRLHVRRRELPRGGEFCVGEPVMMTRNDYERRLFNGDRGVVVRVRDRENGAVATRAVFPGREGYRAFALGPLGADLDRAWSITIHKAQGSEYDSVGIVLPEEPIPLATRELLYTGMTRARRSVAFFGRPELVLDAAGRSDERDTGLVDRIRERIE